MKKAVAIFSGGLDSTTLLHYIMGQDYEIYGLSFDYHQRHLKELTYAKYWGEKMCKEHKIIKLDLEDIMDKSALINKDIDIPEESYSPKTQVVTSVPFRNGIMLSIAVAYAENVGINEVYCATHFNDASVYPDTTKRFITALSLASQLGTYNSVEVKAPFADMTKADVVKLGLDLMVDYSKTLSCYSGEERPCLVCSTCREREEAFRLNNTKDPLLTDEEWKKATVNLTHAKEVYEALS